MSRPKVLIVRLRTDNMSAPYVSHGIYEIQSKTDTEYILDVQPGNKDYLNNPRKSVLIKDVNILKYSEFFIHTIECDNHHDVWYIDGYVYALVNDEQLQRIDGEITFWKHQLFKMAKRSIKSRNKGLKEIFYAIDDLSFNEGDAKSWVESK